jgi:hypothetical protein
MNAFPGWHKAVSSPSRRNRFWRRYLITACLLIVVSVQTARIIWLDQSSWGAGCGFGMFATVDAHGTRFFRISADVGGNQIPVSLDGMFFAEAVAARITPTAGNLQTFLDRLKQEDYFLVTFRKDKDDDQESVLVAGVNAWRARNEGARDVQAVSCRPQNLVIELRGVAFDLEGHRLNSFAKCSVSGSTRLEGDSGD